MAATLFVVWVLYPKASSRGNLVPATMPGEMERLAGTGPDRCVNCHEANHTAPWATAEWHESKHAAKGVGCVDCHGDFHATVASKQVSPATCAKCHEKQSAAFTRGRHSKAMTSIVGHAEFVRQSDAVARQACEACHGIGMVFSTKPAEAHANGNCNSCHGGHAYKLADVRRPDACTVCHTGMGAPQTELVALSKHAKPFAGKNACLQCHDPHDASWGITIGGSGNGAPANGQPADWATTAVAPAERALQRERMVEKCSACHPASFAKKQLRDADAIKLEADAALEELFKLFPRRPDLAKRVDAGGRAEALLFEAVKKHHPGMWKAVYHQAPAPLVEARRELDRTRAEIADWLQRTPSR